MRVRQSVDGAAGRWKFLKYLWFGTPKADSSCYYKDMDPIKDGSYAAVAA
jgi:hypothetical protein